MKIDKTCGQCGKNYSVNENDKAKDDLICIECIKINKELIELKQDLEKNNYVVSADQLLNLFLRQIY